MMRVQTEEEWTRRGREMKEALETISRCIQAAPVLSLTPGASYRLTIAGNVLENGRINLERVGEFAAGAGTRTIVGRYMGRLPAPASAEGVGVSRGSLIVEISEPAEVAGKMAVFADMDVLEYEGTGIA